MARFRELKSHLNLRMLSADTQGKTKMTQPSLLNWANKRLKA